MAPNDPPRWLVFVLIPLQAIAYRPIDERLPAVYAENAYLDFLIWLAIGAIWSAVVIIVTWVVYNAVRASLTRRWRAPTGIGRDDGGTRSDR